MHATERTACRQSSGSRGQLNRSVLEFLDSARSFLESDQDRDIQIFNSMKLHFAKCIALLINGFARSFTHFSTFIKVR